MLDHEYEVIFKNGISHFEREYCAKNWALHVKTSMPFLRGAAPKRRI
jgi:hypothetical protein